MGTKRATYVRFVIVFVLLAVIGIGGTVYTLLHERFTLPLGNRYTVTAQFTAADGVVAGLGQPVNVVGVKVGEVTGSSLQDGRAILTLQIDRSQLPHLYRNASAVLQPITPLENMEIALDPGTPRAGILPPEGTIEIGLTTSPVPLSDLLASLDGDTRDFLTSLIASVGQGTQGQGASISRMLAALGPTAADAGEISRAVASRRTQLAALIHNLATVMHASSQDRQLASVVLSGDQTLHAVAAEDGPLKAAIAQLPATLAVTRSTLTKLGPFAAQLDPTLTALSPAIGHLPATLHALVPFATAATAAISSQIRPFVTAAQPLTRQLANVVPALQGETPYLSGSFQVLEYLANELAYNPNHGDNQGFLFWLSWFVHNFNSVVSEGDANGGIGRAAVMATCYGIQDIAVLQKLLDVAQLCPQ
jgi:phospholipid/cholesterol/gamma-HCH transport system substrate-binding protein